MIKKYVCFYIISIVLLACHSGNSDQVESGQVISVSILPQKYFLERIAGDRFEINVLIPPGASPENYEPSSRQIRDLSRSSLYLSLGNVDFEQGWMRKIEAVNPELKIINTSTGISFITGKAHHHGGHNDLRGRDPHFWMSPKSVKIIARNMLQALTDFDPQNGGIYCKNFDEFMDDLDSIDILIKSETSEITSRRFMIFHPALAYFAKDYGLEQISVEYEGKQPSPVKLKELVDIARQENIKSIMIQRQFDTENAEIIAREIGAEIIQIDPLDEDWLKQIVEITMIICRKN